MRKHRLNSSGAALNLRRLVPKLIIAAILISLTVFFFIYLGKTVKNLDFFRIKDIILNGNDTVELSYLKGQNIFTVDIAKESLYIAQTHPNYKLIRLIRILPNRLCVDFIKRKPIAYVKLYRYFCVDEESVLYDCPLQLEEFDLPLILGLETKIFGPKSGRKYNVRELSLALKIVKEVQTNRLLKDYKIEKINVANTAAASFFMIAPFKISNEASAQFLSFEVKVGQDYITDRFSILGNLLIQTKNRLKDIKYIDLRFKEPVIKFKDAQ